MSFNVKTMKNLALTVLTAAIVLCFLTSSFASAQNENSSQAPLNSTQPEIIAAIGAAATLLFFVLLYKMKKKDSENHVAK